MRHNIWIWTSVDSEFHIFLIPEFRRFMTSELCRFMTPCLYRFATSGLRKFMIPDLHRFATSGLRRFKIPDLHGFATSGLRKFKIPDFHGFATSGLRRFKIPDLRRINHPENLFHEFRQTRRFEGGRFFLNSPTLAPRRSGLTPTIRFHGNFWISVKNITHGTSEWTRVLWKPHNVRIEASSWNCPLAPINGELSL
jgi:hypothetical protein